MGIYLLTVMVRSVLQVFNGLVQYSNGRYKPYYCFRTVVSKCIKDCFNGIAGYKCLTACCRYFHTNMGYPGYIILVRFYSSSRKWKQRCFRMLRPEIIKCFFYILGFLYLFQE